MSRIMAAGAAVIVALVLVSSLVGCGGGGGGGNPSPVPEGRSVNGVGNNVATTTGSRYHKTITLRWVGDKTGTDYGVAKVDTFSKTAGTGDLSLNADGTLDLANDLANDVFKFTFTCTHPTGTGDPDAGKKESGAATITITPEDAKINPGSSNIAEDATVIFAVQAQNARAVLQIVRLDLIKPSRAWVYTPASWKVTPTAAGSFSPNQDGTVAFKTAAGFSGDITVTATVVGSNQALTFNATVVAHPTAAISTPTEGQTVSGQTSVQFTVTHAFTATLVVDDGTTTDVTGQSSYSLDTTKLTNGSHSLTLKAVGLLETATLVRNFTVNNQQTPPPYDPGKPSKLTNTGTNTFNYGKVAPNIYQFKTGGYVVLDLADTIRYFDASGNFLKSASFNDIGYTMTVTPDDHVSVPCFNRNGGQVMVFDKNGAVIKTLATGAVTNARFNFETQSVVISGPVGRQEYDLAFNQKSSQTGYTFSSCSDQKYTWYQDQALVLWRLDRETGAKVNIGTFGILYDMYCFPGRELIVCTDRSAKRVITLTKGENPIISSLSLPGNEQVLGIGVNLANPDIIYVSGATSPFAYIFKAIDQ